jgi:hypothetical protein
MTTMLASLQLATATLLVFSETVFVPCAAPKFAPEIVTKVPTIPDNGERLVTTGKPDTVKPAPFVATPFTVAITLPVVAPVGTAATINVALQLLIVVAVVPLNPTVLEP